VLLLLSSLQRGCRSCIDDFGLSGTIKFVLCSGVVFFIFYLFHRLLCSWGCWAYLFIRPFNGSHARAPYFVNWPRIDRKATGM
jgi:hypothetical protein